MLIVLLSLGSLFQCAGADEKAVSAGGKNFRLDAEVVEALEGGPVVVKATLVYCGDGPVRICGDPL